MRRRHFLQALAAAGSALLLRIPPALAALPKMKITRIRAYEPSAALLAPDFPTSNRVITVETDAGITGIGEGGFPDTLRLRAGRLIGQDPKYIEHLWQDMSRAFFYPPGRELQHAIGALDMALWDIRGKALKVPVHELLGGPARNYVECYTTFADRPGIVPGVKEGMGIKEVAALVMAAGYRAYRMDAASLRGKGPYNTRERVRQVYKDAVQAREGVGEDGDWCIDFHQRFDLSDAVRAAKLIEPLAPLFVEDPMRAVMFAQDLPKFRQMTSVPVAPGEEWGGRWEFNRHIEEHEIDYLRASLPNVGGITEMMKIAALCETHAVGMIPHFTGPIATAALVNCLCTFSGTLLMECNYDGKPLPYLPVYIDLRNGKLWPNERPGLGVEIDLGALTKVLEVDQPTAAGRYYTRPDGSITDQ